MLKGLLDKVRASIHAHYFKMPASVAAATSSSVRSSSSTSSLGAAAEAQDPIDLAMITNRLRLNDYYRTQAMLREDLLRMVSSEHAAAIDTFAQLHVLLVSLIQQHC